MNPSLSNSTAKFYRDILLRSLYSIYEERTPSHVKSLSEDENFPGSNVRDQLVDDCIAQAMPQQHRDRALQMLSLTMYRNQDRNLHAQCSRARRDYVHGRFERQFERLVPGHGSYEPYLQRVFLPGLHFKWQQIASQSIARMARKMPENSYVRYEFTREASSCATSAIERFPLLSWAGVEWEQRFTLSDLAVAWSDPNLESRAEVAYRVMRRVQEPTFLDRTSSGPMALFDLRAAATVPALARTTEQTIGFDEYLGLALPLYRFFDLPRASIKQYFDMRKRVVSALWPHIADCVWPLDQRRHQQYVADANVTRVRSALEHYFYFIDQQASLLMQQELNSQLEALLRSLIAEHGPADEKRIPHKEGPRDALMWCAPACQQVRATLEDDELNDAQAMTHSAPALD